MGNAMELLRSCGYSEKDAYNIMQGNAPRAEIDIGIFTKRNNRSQNTNKNLLTYTASHDTMETRLSRR